MVVNEQAEQKQSQGGGESAEQTTTEPQSELPVELQELPLETTLKEKRYTIQEYQTKMLDVWIYVVEDKEEKYKRYKKKILKLIDHNDKLDMSRVEQLEKLKSIENLSANVIKYLDVFIDHEKRCLGLIFELTKLSTLETQIKNREYDFKNSTITNWGIQMLKGLEFLHDQKITHFDITTANVFITIRNHAKIGDLPLHIPTLDSFVSEGRGTLNYMAPEVINGNVAKMTDKEKQKVDIWSFGCIIYELINLQKAFDNQDLRELAKSIVSCSIDLPENVDENLEYFLKSSIKKDHRERGVAKDIIAHVEEKLHEKFDAFLSLGLEERTPYGHDINAYLSSLQCIASVNEHQASVTASIIYEDPHSKDDFLITASRDKSARVWNIDSTDCVRKFDTDEDDPTSVVVLGQKILLLGTASHNELRTWKLDSGIQLDNLLIENAKSIHSLLEYKNSIILVGTNHNVEMRQINVGPICTSNSVASFEGHQGAVLTMCYYQDMRKLITGSTDATIRIWSMNDQKKIRILFGHEKPVLAIVVAENTRLISSAADSTIIIWNLLNGDCLKTLRDHTDWVTCLIIRKDQLISGSDDKTLRVWDIDNRKCTKIIKEHEINVLTLALARNNKLISTASDGCVKIWNSY